MLTNVMLYCLSRIAGSSANTYYENAHAMSWGRRLQVSPPPPKKSPIRRYAERRNNIVHWSDFSTRDHFAAMGVPALLVNDVRKVFRELR